MKAHWLFLVITAAITGCEKEKVFEKERDPDYSGIYNVQVHKVRSGPMIRNPIDTVFATTLQLTHHTDTIEATLVSESLSRQFTLLNADSNVITYRYMGFNPFQLCYIRLYPADSIEATFGDGYLGGSTSWVMTGTKL